MKKKFLLFTLFLSVASVLLGQKDIVSFVPNSTDTIFSVDLVAAYQPLVMEGYIQNNSNQKIQIRWERNPIQVPSDWSVQIHDKNTCYAEFVNSNIDEDLVLNEPIVLEPKEKARLDVQFIPNGKAGKAVLALEISLANEPQVIIASEEYEVEVRSKFNQPNVSAKVFPNPSGNFLNLSQTNNADRMVVYNMVGRAVKDFKIEENANYDISNLPDGIYLVGIFDRRGNVIKTSRVSKRAVRP